MNLTATLTFADLDVTASPVSIAHYEIKMTDNAGVVAEQSQSIAPGSDSATFSAVPAGTYTFTAQAFDTNGNAVGTSVSTPFTVTAPVQTVTVKVPSAIAITGV